MTAMNFRIILHDLPSGTEVSYGIHEVFCDRKGNVVSWAERPVIVGSTIEELAREVDYLIRNLDRFPDPLVLSDLLSQNKQE